MGRPKKRTKDHIEILRGGFRTHPAAHGPSGRAVFPFPAPPPAPPGDPARGGRGRGEQKKGLRPSTSENPNPPLTPGQTRPYPVLPLRDIVVFPHMIVPLFVGREKSIRALEEVMRSD